MAGEAPGSLHGWGCTPTGETPPTVASENASKPACLPVLLRGWRKTALYCILVFLMVLIFLNIGLTLWIISSLKLRMGGFGPVNIVNGGIELQGQAFVMDNLIASTISSRAGQPITLHSHRNFSVLVTEPERKETAKLVLKRDSIECSGRMFEVRDAHGGGVFRASRDEVRVFSDALAVDGPGGLAVRTAVQAPSVRAPPGSDLQLESLTRHLELIAPQSIHLESRAGGIDVTAHSNIKLDSVVGALKIDTPSIFISNLKEALKTESAPPTKHVRPQKVYQLCACASGKLFLAAADASCAANNADTDFCR
ncbi:delta-sarcoglycan-like [Cydia splendana]|uniref:delta-sarcoglycan-like n=1 Tax=Cydia splendana TaxID=1100963 RepID=UPI002124032A